MTGDKTTPLRDVIFLKSQRGEEISDLDLRVRNGLVVRIAQDTVNGT